MFFQKFSRPWCGLWLLMDEVFLNFPKRLQTYTSSFSSKSCIFFDDLFQVFLMAWLHYRPTNSEKSQSKASNNSFLFDSDFRNFLKLNTIYSRAFWKEIGLPRILRAWLTSQATADRLKRNCSSKPTYQTKGLGFVFPYHLRLNSPSMSLPNNRRFKLLTTFDELITNFVGPKNVAFFCCSASSRLKLKRANKFACDDQAFFS